MSVRLLWEEADDVLLLRGPSLGGALTLTGPAQCLEEPMERKADRNRPMTPSREGPERPGRQKGRESESEIPRHTPQHHPISPSTSGSTSHLQSDLSAAAPGRAGWGGGTRQA